MKFRTPVVAILGHVDHGKTSLLDFIRRSHLTDREFGGITQKIGAYEVDTKIEGYDTSKITFIDTPGHEAFTSMRSLGARTADIAILLVDGKDSVMPQTIESIKHILESKTPFIVAINKCDLPEANPVKVERDLLRQNIQTEKQGGKTIALPISAKTGKGVSELLEAILLTAHDLKLEYDPAAPVEATVIETTRDKQGIIATVIPYSGTIKIGDSLITTQGSNVKVRALISDTKTRLQEITPSTPAIMLGFVEIPAVGTRISSLSLHDKSKETKEVVQKNAPKPFNLQSIIAASKPQEKRLSAIIKVDSQGSLDAINFSINSNPLVKIELAAIGDIHKSDILLARATNAIVIGFGVSPDPETLAIAAQEKVIIKTYRIIYELIEELEEVAGLIAEKEYADKNLKGEAKILATFKIEGEQVYGLQVTKGKFSPGDQLSVYRDNNAYGKVKIISLKVRAKKVAEVKKGEECGMLLTPPLDIRIGDIVKCIL